MRRHISIFSALLVLFVSSCLHAQNLSVYGHDNISDTEILERMKEYYLLEANKEWDKTYKFRTSLFRSTVSQNYYTKEMRRNSTNWELLSIEFLREEIINNDKIKVLIKFQTNNNKGPLPRTMTFTEKTIWIKYDDEWYSLMPGTRGYLSLNEKIVNE